MTPKGVIRLGEKDFPTWPFVLNKAHEMGLIAIETTLIQIPTDENGKVAIVQAVATFAPTSEGGPVRRFSGLGDAGPHNVSAKIAGATIRMAETRSMGRALRAGTNIGESMYEELGEDMSESAVHRTAAPAAAPRPPARHEPGYEETFVEGERTYRRADLVTYATQAQEQAMQQGIRVETIVPYQATNEALVAFGRAIRPKLAVVKATADGKQGEAEAKRGGVEVSA